MSATTSEFDRGVQAGLSMAASLVRAGATGDDLAKLLDAEAAAGWLNDGPADRAVGDNGVQFWPLATVDLTPTVPQEIAAEKADAAELETTRRRVQTMLAGLAS